MLTSRFSEMQAGINDNLLNKSRILIDSEKINKYKSVSASQVEVIEDPARQLQIIVDAIQSATQYICIEYYIIQNDSIGNAILDLLVKKASEGIKVYLIYDWYGSFRVNRSRLKKLTKSGGIVLSFSPFHLIFRFINPNLRNHRKLIIIDGKLAITGSANVGRKYQGKKHKEQNRDYIITLRGQVCEYLKSVFCLDWKFCIDEDLILPKTDSSPVPGKYLVQVIESGPHSSYENLHETIINLINSATQSLCIASPYFIPSEPVMYALRLACRKNVSVTILVPKRSDSRLVDYASRSFSRELVACGASIYQFERRFLHSKMIIVDERYALLGTPNVDCRSFRLNFELSLLFDGEEVARRSHEIFQEDLKKSRRFLPIAGKWTLILENFLRIFSPQL